jgi:DNA ligase-1
MYSFDFFNILNDSLQIKTSLIQKMMGAAKSIEIRFLVRALQGKMRMGCHESTVLSALAKALSLTPPAIYLADASIESVDRSHSLGSKLDECIDACLAVLKKVYSEVPNFELIISTILEKGVANLPSYCFLTPGVPIKAMLAKPTKGISEILERLKNVLFTLEYKYDGERAQVRILSLMFKLIVSIRFIICLTELSRFLAEIQKITLANFLTLWNL